MKNLLCALCVALVLATAPGCKNESIQNIDEALDTLNRHNVNYEGELELSGNPGFELFSGGRVTATGRAVLRLRSPSTNQGGVNPKPETPTSQPAGQAAPSNTGSGCGGCVNGIVTASASCETSAIEPPPGL